jgi:hypothetical protein
VVSATVAGTKGRGGDRQLLRSRLPVEFTRGQHFRFGYDDDAFCRRPSPSATYWVAFGRPARPSNAFRRELRQSLSDIFGRHGNMTLTNAGGPVSRAVIWEAKEMGLPIEVLTVEIEGHGFPSHNKAVPHRHHKITWEAFAAFAREFAETADCPDAWLALDAYHGVVSDRPHIHGGYGIRFFPDDFDASPAWTVANDELSTGLHRWCIATERVAIPSVFYWSPELIVAQITSSSWRERVARASQTGLQTGPINMRWNTYQLVRSVYPNLTMSPTPELARSDAALDKRMSELSRELRRAHPSDNAVHHEPLARFLAHHDVRRDFYDGR